MKDLVAFDESLKTLERQQSRREALRVKVSSIVNLMQADFNQVGGKIYNLSTGGIGIRTNYPIAEREWLSLVFDLPDTIGHVRAEGEVVWRQFHGDTPGHKGALFTVGIRFLSLGEPSRKAVHDYVRISNAP
jgi:hypothetical protein